MRGAALLLWLLAAPAAACPVAADLGRGIAVTMSDGSRLVFREAGPGVVALESRGGPGGDEDVTLAWGVYPTLIRSGFAPDDPMALDYAGGVAALPRPAAGAFHEGAVTASTRAEGKQPGRIAVAFGAEATATVAGCPYAAIEVRQGLSLQPGWTTGLLYLADLGIALPAWVEDGGVRAMERTATAIEALP